MRSLTEAGGGDHYYKLKFLQGLHVFHEFTPKNFLRMHDGWGLPNTVSFTFAIEDGNAQTKSTAKTSTYTVVRVACQCSPMPIVLAAPTPAGLDSPGPAGLDSTHRRQLD